MARSDGLDFSLTWSLLSTVLVWAGPAQLIVVTALAADTSAIEGAITMTLSGMRLLPMVAALLPSVVAAARAFHCGEYLG